MNVFVRAVITGFGYSLGSSLYKKLSKRFESDDSSEESDAAAPAPPVAASEQANAPDSSDGDHPDNDSPSDPN